MDIKLTYDFEAVIICAVRYCLGRQTYMPSLVIGEIEPLVPHLTYKTIDCMKRDIERAPSLGDKNIDVPLWNKFYGLLAAELESRK